MRKNDKKLFLNKRKLWDMLNYRLNGYGISTLSLMYHCDAKAIRYQCEKYKIEPKGNVYVVERIVSKVAPKAAGNWKIVNNEWINQGKSYKDYMEEAKSRNYPEAKYSPKN